MRRVLLHVTLLFLSGIVLAAYAPLINPYLLTATVVAVMSAGGVVVLAHALRRRPLPAILLAFFFLAAGYLYSQSYWAFRPNLLQSYYEQQVQVTGVTEESPVYLNGKWQYTIRVETLAAENGIEVSLKDRIRVADSRKNGPPSYGDRVAIRGLLLEPSSRRNPGGYDDREFLERQGIHGRIRVKDDDAVKKIGAQTTLYGLTVAPLGERIRHALAQLFPPGEAELAGGLVIGFQSELPEEWKNAFQMLNLTHILAASGMNVGLIAGCTFWLTRRIRMSKRIASPIAIGILLLYTMLAGAGPSVVRAGLMAILVIVGVSLGRNVDFPTTVAVAALASSLWNPGILFDIGFLLSFITTIGLFLLIPRLTPLIPGPAWARSAVAVNLAAQIASLPLLVYYFNELSPFALLANLYISPIVFLLVPLGFGLILLGVVHPWLAFPFAGFFRVLLWLLVKPVVWLAEATSGWTWTIPSPPLWGVWLVYGLLLAFLFRRQVRTYLLRLPLWRRIRQLPAGLQSAGGGKRRLSAGIVGAAVLLAAVGVWLWPSSELRVTFLDVGQGDSALIETPSGISILVDGGGTPDSLRSGFDPGEKIVLPFLRHRGIRTIDYMIATHGDEDHVRGLVTVAEKLKVRNLIVSGYDDTSPDYRQLLQIARRKGAAIYESKAGIEWELEPGIWWRFLNPAGIRTGTRSDRNANSVVFELKYGNRSFLFAGDLEGQAEPDLLPYVRPVDVLKVAHHGSHFSTSEEFLQRVRPQYAVISVGKRNVYRHPHSEVLQRLASVGSQVFRTDRQGAVTVTTDGKYLRIQTAVKEKNPIFGKK